MADRDLFRKQVTDVNRNAVQFIHRHRTMTDGISVAIQVATARCRRRSHAEQRCEKNRYDDHNSTQHPRRTSEIRFRARLRCDGKRHECARTLKSSGTSSDRKSCDYDDKGLVSQILRLQGCSIGCCFVNFPADSRQNVCIRRQ